MQLEDGSADPNTPILEFERCLVSNQSQLQRYATVAQALNVLPFLIF